MSTTPQDYWCSPHEAIAALQEEVRRLRAENATQSRQIADAAYLLQGSPVASLGYEAHSILCGKPPEVK